MSKEEFIEFVGALASEDMKKTGILASLTVAQAIKESGYGTSELATKAKALFGIKVHDWTGKVYSKKTNEFVSGKYIVVTAEFRAYNSWEESIADHSRYLTTREKAPGVLRYANLIGETDYKKACEKIQADGYATDPEYAKGLIALIERYNLTRFDKEVENVVKIAIDAGHGLKTAGKRCLKKLDPNQTREWALNSRIADKLIMLLKGYNCEIIRTDDTTGATDVSRSDRVKKANTWGANVFVSIHHNAGAKGKSAGGTVVYYCSSKKERPIQAKELYNAVVKETGLIGNRVTKVKNYPYYVVKNTTMPAFLLENGFMDSSTDVPVILSEAHATKTARALRDFLVNMFGLEKEPEEISFKVKITTDELNYRSGPGTDYAIRGVVKKGEVFTIVDTSGSWGKLKSGAGWINISQKYVTRL